MKKMLCISQRFHILSVFLFIFVSTSGFSQDMVSLKNGDIIVGEIIIDPAVADGFVIKRWLDQVEIFIKWEQIPQMEKERIVGKTSPGIQMIEADKIVTSGQTFIGIIQNEDTAFIYLKQKDQPEPTKIKKADVIERQKVKVPEDQIYSNQEILERVMKETDFNNYRQALEVVRLAQRFKLYEYEKNIWEKLIAIFPEKKDYIMQQIAIAKENLLNQNADNLYQQIETAMQQNDFQKAKELANKLVKEFPDSKIVKSKPRLLEEIGEKEKQYLQNREEFLSKEVVKHYWDLRKKFISKVASIRKVKEVMDEVKKLDENVVKEICEKLKCTKKEFNKWFENRPQENKSAGYEDGTWIIKGGRSGSIKIPVETPKGTKEETIKLDTQDEWWRDATESKRKQWLEAYHAENSKLLKVVEVKEEDCSTCKGEGDKTRTIYGKQYKFPCKRCHGVKKDKIVVYY